MHWMTPLVIDGHIYGFAGRNKPDVQFRCVNLNDGSIVWKDDMRYQFELNGRNLTLSFLEVVYLGAMIEFLDLGKMEFLLSLIFRQRG